MASVVIDTNVLISANGKDTHASELCQLRCIQTLRLVKNSKITAIDSAGEIFGEYKNYMDFSGQPGTGDEFFKFLVDNMRNTNHIELVKITPHGDSYKEFPNDPGLTSFDRSDRKFVAVSSASDANPPIINATDSDWSPVEKILSKHGITIQQLCPDMLKAIHD